MNEKENDLVSIHNEKLALKYNSSSIIIIMFFFKVFNVQKKFLYLRTETIYCKFEINMFRMLMKQFLLFFKRIPSHINN